MSKPGTRTAASLVAAAALSVSVSVLPTAPSAVAADARPSGQAVSAKPAAASLKTLKARLRKAVKAQKAASAAVGTATAKVTAAKDAGTAAIFAFQAATVAADEARAKHATAKAALDRAQGYLANEGALWADLDQRTAAAQARVQALRDAYTAAEARRTELQDAVQSLRAEQSTAAGQQNAAAVEAGNLEAYDIPQTRDALNAALAAEHNALVTREDLQADFARRRAQWDDTRKNFGHWEGLRNGTWRALPALDDAEARLNQAQQDYAVAVARRQDVEGYFNTLVRRLEAARAAVAQWAAVFADLQRQIDGHAQPLADRSAAVRAASDALSSYQTNTVEPLYRERDKLAQDIQAAKANLPSLVAAEKPLAAAVAQTAAALAAAAPAHDAAQAVIDAATSILTQARADLVRATSKVARIKKQIRKAKGRR